MYIGGELGTRARDWKGESAEHRSEAKPWKARPPEADRRERFRGMRHEHFSVCAVIIPSPYIYS